MHVKVGIKIFKTKVSLNANKSPYHPRTLDSFFWKFKNIIISRYFILILSVDFVIIYYKNTLALKLPILLSPRFKNDKR